MRDPNTRLIKRYVRMSSWRWQDWLGLRFEPVAIPASIVLGGLLLGLLTYLWVDTWQLSVGLAALAGPAVAAALPRSRAYLYAGEQHNDVRAQMRWVRGTLLHGGFADCWQRAVLHSDAPDIGLRVVCQRGTIVEILLTATEAQRKEFSAQCNERDLLWSEADELARQAVARDQTEEPCSSGASASANAPFRRPRHSRTASRLVATLRALRPADRRIALEAGPSRDADPLAEWLERFPL